jgi:hypothetical protein
MDPMLWISAVSGIVFAFVGNWMARRRGAHTIIWTGLGFLFPPSLLILKVWRWEAKPPEDDTEA